MIGLKDARRRASDPRLLAIGETTMTLYLAGVIAAFAAFGAVLFGVSTWTNLKK